MQPGRYAAAIVAALVAVLPVAASAAPTGSTMLVSRPTGLGPVPPAFDNDSQTPGELSSDGRYAVFTSKADGFAPGADPKPQNVLLRDRQTNQTILVSRSDGMNGAGVNSDAFSPAIAIAPSGVMPTAPTNQPHVLVTFVSAATNLVDHVSGQTLGQVPLQVLMRDVTAGTTTLVSRADGMSGAPANGGVDRDSPGVIGVAPGGPVVAFQTTATNLPGGRGGVFLRTVNAGDTEVVSCQNDDCSGTPVAGAAFRPAMAVTSSTVGVAFESSDTTVTQDPGSHSQVMWTLANAPQHPADGAGPFAFFFVVSRKSNTTTFGNGDSFRPSISSDFGNVAFLSRATNLTGDTLPPNTQEAFVHSLNDTSTSLVSRAGGAGGAVANRTVNSVALGGDPSHLRVVFDSDATNLGVPGTSGQAYVRDLTSNVTALLNRGAGASGVPGDRFSDAPGISAGGGVALFTTSSGNLGDGSGGRFERVHARTLPAASVGSGAVGLVSRPSGTAPFQSRSDESSLSAHGAVSANGRFVVFSSQSSSLAPGVNPLGNYNYVRDLLTNRTILVSRASGPAGALPNRLGDDDVGGISADGRFVEFDSNATNLAPGANGQTQVYVRDLRTDMTTLISRQTGPGGAVAAQGAFAVGLSADGKTALLASQSPLAPAGKTGVFHLYARRLDASTTKLVDRDSGPAGAATSGGFDDAAVDADGNRIIFTTPSALAGSPADGIQRAFVRDLRAGTTTLVSRADGATGAATDGDSDSVAIDGAGDKVAFSTYAQNLGQTFVNHQVFVRNLTTSHTQFISGLPGPGPGRASDAERPSFDAAGDRVSMILEGTPQDPNLFEAYVRDLSAAAPLEVSRASGVAGADGNGDSALASLDPTGNCVAFDSSSTNLGDGFSSFDFTAVHVRVLRGQCPLPSRLTKLSIKPKRVGKSGAKIHFILDQPLSVILTFTQLIPGRQVGSRCVHGRKHGKRCTLRRRRGRLTIAGQTGVNTIKLTRRINGKRLPKGRYRITAKPFAGPASSVVFSIRR